jgi:hypothetical protein
MKHDRWVQKTSPVCAECQGRTAKSYAKTCVEPTRPEIAVYPNWHPRPISCPIVSPEIFWTISRKLQPRLLPGPTISDDVSTLAEIREGTPVYMFRS